MKSEACLDYVPIDDALWTEIKRQTGLPDALRAEIDRVAEQCSFEKVDYDKIRATSVEARTELKAIAEKARKLRGEIMSISSEAYKFLVYAKDYGEDFSLINDSNRHPKEIYNSFMCEIRAFEDICDRGIEWLCNKGDTHDQRKISSVSILIDRIDRIVNENDASVHLCRRGDDMNSWIYALCRKAGIEFDNKKMKSVVEGVLRKRRSSRG